jgi:hypothetical protein
VKIARASYIGALLAACAACAHGKPAGDPSDSTPTPTAPSTSTSTATQPSAPAENEHVAARLASIRAEVDALLAAQGRLLWDMWTRGAPTELDAAGSARESLFSPETLAFVREARDHAEGDERRALALLHGFLVGEHLARAAAAEVPDAGAPALVWNGRTVPIARAPSLLAAEPDPAQRAALERAWVEAERKRGPQLDARWKAISAAAARLGYPSLLALAVELRGESADGLGALAEGVLATTDAAYRALLGRLARVELSRRLPDVRGRDVPRLFRAAEDPRSFPAPRLAGDAEGTFAAMGLAVSGRPGVLVDADARPGKDPRALALPVEVPGSVRVSYAPLAGAAELRGLLHELGAAAFYSHVSTPVMEFRRLGAVTADAWAGLFEDLAADPAWLAEHTGLAETHVDAIVRAATARQLHRARALAARLLVELGRAGGPAFGPNTAKAVLERAFARPVEADELELFLSERDPLLECADALRALLVAAQADAYLVERVPAPWWRGKEAGALLADLFADGSRLDPATLSRALGAAGVDARALDARVRRRTMR